MDIAACCRVDQGYRPTVVHSHCYITSEKPPGSLESRGSS